MFANRTSIRYCTVRCKLRNSLPCRGRCRPSDSLVKIIRGKQYLPPTHNTKIPRTLKATPGQTVSTAWQDQMTQGQQMIQMSYAKDVTKGMLDFESGQSRSASKFFLPIFRKTYADEFQEMFSSICYDKDREAHGDIQSSRTNKNTEEAVTSTVVWSFIGQPSAHSRSAPPGTIREDESSCL